MQPTQAFRWFVQARERGRTVAEMMTGRMCPLSNLEDVLWTHHAKAEARFRQQEQPKGKRR